MATLTETRPEAPAENIRTLRLFKATVIHAVQSWTHWHTICGIDLVDRVWVHVPPPVTCENCLQALGCLPQEG